MTSNESTVSTADRLSFTLFLAFVLHAALIVGITFTIPASLPQQQTLDITLVHKYDANTKIVTGYSHYFTTLTHSLLNGSGLGDSTLNNNDDQSWFYMMIDTTF